MARNLFSNSKTLVDIYGVFNEKHDIVIDFANLNEDEKEKLVAVFAANVPEGIDVPELPLTEAGYTHVWNVTVDVVEAMASKEMEESFMNSVLNNTKATIDTAIDKINAGCAGFKRNLSNDANEASAQCDESLTYIKNNLAGVIGILGDAFGLTTLRDELYTIIWDETKSGSKNGFFRAAEECRKAVRDYVDDILDTNPDKEGFKKIVALRYTLGQDADGNDIAGHQSIFTVAFRSIVYVCKIVSKFFKKYFGTDAKTNIFGSAGAAIASIFGVAAGVIKGVIKIVAEAVLFVGSYILSAVLNVFVFVKEQLQKLYGTVKNKLTKKDVEEILDDFEDDDFDNEVAE